MSNLKDLKPESFESEVLKASQPVLVDFYAPWCGPCKMMAPMLDEMAGAFAGRVTFYKVNVDDAQELASQHNITGVPTLLLFSGGEAKERIVGMTPPATLRDKLEAVAGGAATPPEA